MQVYVLRRLLLMVPVMLIVSTVTFMVMRILPGDLAQRILGDYATPEGLAQLRAQLGLDRPLYVQYFEWLGGILRGDLGSSRTSNLPVAELIRVKMPLTLELTVLAVFFSLLIAIPVGIVSARRPDGPLDYLGRIISIGGIALPSFWVGTLAIIVPSILWNYSPPNYVSFREDPLKNLELVVPASLVLGFALSASLMRLTRATLLEVLNMDYIRTARAKGLRDAGIIYRHALRNGLIPVVTLSGLQFAALLGGTVIIEQIYALPGIGRVLLTSILQRDYPTVQGIVLMMAFIFVLTNLLIDLSYAVLDPRIRYR
ncbi:MAG: ABC transporter permease [Dehalococcoidia bacterium]